MTGYEGRPRVSARAFASVVVALVLPALVAGCSATASAPSMVPPSLPRAEGLAPAAIVEVSGSSGEGFDLISNEDFAEALTEALRKANVLSVTTASGGAAYRLQVVLLSQDNPAMGFNMRSGLATAWILTDSGTGAVVWKKGVHTDGEASYGEAFVGASRLQIAVEEAARENIREGIRQLAELDLASGGGAADRSPETAH